LDKLEDLQDYLQGIEKHIENCFTFIFFIKPLAKMEGLESIKFIGKKEIRILEKICEKQIQSNIYSIKYKIYTYLAKILFCHINTDEVTLCLHV
jgi:hypothetical protein